MKTLIKYKDPKKLTELFQSLDIKFSFVIKKGEDTYEQCMTPVICRDFLGDCVWSRKTGKVVNIYDFEYSFTKNPFDKDTLRLSLSFPNMETKEDFKNNFPYLLAKDEKAGVSPTMYWETDDENTLIIEASPHWQESIWKISLYTFFLKCISYKTSDDVKEPEASYLTYLSPESLNILLSQIKDGPKELMEENIRPAHNYSGFVSILRGYNKEMQQLLLG